MQRLPVIGVMGSHEKTWDRFAEPLGKLIAQHDYHLLTGAGAGVMSAVAKAFTEVDDRLGMSIGIVPTLNYTGNLLCHEEYPNPYIEVPILTPLDAKAQNDKTPYSRNYVNIMSSNALVVLPGEHGTRNEVSIALQYSKPMILFGPIDAFKQFPEHPARVDTVEEVQEFLAGGSINFRTEN